ncbi:hypothetical protein HK102_012736, partial [Quaeritorhiza haematococci]
DVTGMGVGMGVTREATLNRISAFAGSGAMGAGITTTTTGGTGTGNGRDLVAPAYPESREGSIAEGAGWSDNSSFLKDLGAGNGNGRNGAASFDRYSMQSVGSERSQRTFPGSNLNPKAGVVIPIITSGGSTTSVGDVNGRAKDDSTAAKRVSGATTATTATKTTTTSGAGSSSNEDDDEMEDFDEPVWQDNPAWSTNPVWAATGGSATSQAELAPAPAPAMLGASAVVAAPTFTSTGLASPNLNEYHSQLPSAVSATSDMRFNDPRGTWWNVPSHDNQQTQPPHTASLNPFTASASTPNTTTASGGGALSPPPRRTSALLPLAPPTPGARPGPYSSHPAPAPR